MAVDTPPPYKMVSTAVRAHSLPQGPIASEADLGVIARPRIDKRNYTLVSSN